VFNALGAATHVEAQARVRELDARDYNPFHLLLADRTGARIVWGDGERLHELELGPGIHWITERSFAAGESARHQTLTELAVELAGDRAGGPAGGRAPDVARWRSILADHRPHQAPGVAPRAWSVGLDAMCVHARPINYGTRSSTLVQVSAEAQLRFWYADGRPCETEFVDYADAVVQLLSA
jgi:hypothetical protein